MRQKLITNDPCFPKDNDKFTYIYSRLGGQAANKVASYIERQKEEGYTHQNFLDHLMENFDNPHR